jgi:hypothetical protein
MHMRVMDSDSEVSGVVELDDKEVLREAQGCQRREEDKKLPECGKLYPSYICWYKI